MTPLAQGMRKKDSRVLLPLIPSCQAALLPRLHSYRVPEISSVSLCDFRPKGSYFWLLVDLECVTISLSLTPAL